MLVLQSAVTLGSTTVFCFSTRGVVQSLQIREFFGLALGNDVVEDPGLQRVVLEEGVDGV